MPDTIPPDKDDWLDDVDEGLGDDIFSELDQANIDALLSGGLEDDLSDAAVPVKDELDDIMAGGDDVKVAEDEGALDQVTIDSLFGGGGATREAEEEPVPIKAEAGKVSEEESLSLDQTDIDSLFGGVSDAEEKLSPSMVEAGKEEDGGFGELDHADIDSLLSAPNPIAAAPSAKEADVEQEEEDWSELDQANIDALLNNETVASASIGTKAIFEEEILGGEDSEPSTGGVVPSQEEMDKMFAETTKGADAKEVGTTGKKTEDDSFGFDDFDFSDDDDIPDIPDFDDSVGTSSVSAEKGTQVDEKGAKKAEKQEKTKRILPATLLSRFSGNKRYLGIGAGLVVLLIGIGLFFTLRPGNESLTIEKTSRIQPQAEQPPVSAPMAETPAVETQTVEIKAIVNIPPSVTGGAYQMMGTSREVPVLLSGQDSDGDPLTYEIVENPKFGRLLGTAPNLVYLAGNEFPGEDKLEFRVSDGKEVSQTESIIIAGPNILKMMEEAAQAKAVKKKDPRVAAKDMEYKSLSTDGIIINWSEIWLAANGTPTSPAVTVELEPGRIKGRLEKLNSFMHEYFPDPFFSGEEKLGYRFVVGKDRSTKKVLSFQIKPGDPPPEIKKIVLNKDSFLVGEVVEIDASETVDDKPEMLRFKWEQLAGATVVIKPRNLEGSIVRIIAPASFYNEKEYGPLLRVTAFDQAGQASESREIRIKVASRRQAALWGGWEARALLSQACPHDDCVTGLLP